MKSTAYGRLLARRPVIKAILHKLKTINNLNKKPDNHWDEVKPK